MGFIDVDIGWHEKKEKNYWSPQFTISQLLNQAKLSFLMKKLGTHFKTNDNVKKFTINLGTNINSHQFWFIKKKKLMWQIWLIHNHSLTLITKEKRRKRKKIKC